MCQRRMLLGLTIEDHSKLMDIHLKSARDLAANVDGCRVLVDRIWPRGVSKEEADLDAWEQELAPSDELRKWFDHDPDRFEEFRRRYIEELRSERSRLTVLRRQARDGRLTLVFGAGDEDHNNAVVLADVLRQGLPRDGD